MPLDQLGAIGEFIGGLAVLVTIAYLAVQVRALRTELHLNAYMQQTESYNATTNAQSTSVDLAKVLAKAEEDFSKLERWEWFLLEGHLAAWMNTTELALVQVSNDALAGEIEAEKVLRLFFSRPGASEFWKIHESSYPESLREQVRQLGLST